MDSISKYYLLSEYLEDDIDLVADSIKELGKCKSSRCLIKKCLEDLRLKKISTHLDEVLKNIEKLKTWKTIKRGLFGV